MTDKLNQGVKVRREVMGDEFVDRALDNCGEFGQPMQDHINEHCWGSTWQRDGLARDTRSLVTIALLIPQGATTELKGHVRGALNNGCTPEEIREVILHSAVYCGAPAAQNALRAAREVLEL
ncbi:MAG: carboxymuconolactone decarboxylase family protein [Pontibacterium sp.]